MFTIQRNNKPKTTFAVWRITTVLTSLVIELRSHCMRFEGLVVNTAADFPVLK